MLYKIHILFYIKDNQSNTLKYKKYINQLKLIVNFGAKNGPVDWNGLSLI